VKDGSRESQPSGRELLPDLPPRDFVLGGLTIAPQLAGGEGALGFRADLREVFPAPRQPRGQVHQPANGLNKLPLLRVPTPVGAFGPLSAPHDNRFPETVGRRRRIVGPLGRRTTWWGDLSRPAGPGWGNHRPVGPIRWPARWAYPLAGPLGLSVGGRCVEGTRGVIDCQRRLC
jgi:hypothetical protein